MSRQQFTPQQTKSDAATPATPITYTTEQSLQSNRVYDTNHLLVWSQKSSQPDYSAPNIKFAPKIRPSFSNSKPYTASLPFSQRQLEE